MKKRLKGKFILFTISCTLIIITFVFYSKKFEYSNDFRKTYSIFPVHIPEKPDFAGEEVPLKNFDVKESLDRELHINIYWQSHTILLIKRANRFFPEIENILKKEGIPSDFKYLAVAESDLTNTISPSGATGFWQFLKKTAKEYNLEINNEVDERYNLEKSTHAACKFLKDSYNIYKNWTLAAASYNIGRSEFSKQMSKQKENNYYNLFLNDETARYIFRILAIKIIMENPDLYGFHIHRYYLYPPLKYYTLVIDSGITNLALFAKKHETNYKILRTLNPWLLDSTLTNSSKATYKIRIPVKGYRETIYDSIDFSIDTLSNL